MLRNWSETTDIGRGIESRWAASVDFNWIAQATLPVGTGPRAECAVMSCGRCRWMHLRLALER